MSFAMIRSDMRRKLRLEWTRLQPIRTAAHVELEFAAFTSEPSRYAQIRDEARRMRRLGMSLRAIGRSLCINEKTVRRALSLATTDWR